MATGHEADGKPPRPGQTRPFHAMAKPSGADCNLNCRYCFYLEKRNLYPSDGPRRMSRATLERYVRHYIDAIPDDREVAFTWQGGEPALMGLDFYRHAVTLQLRHGRGRRISNSFQTNGTLLDDAWCEFLRRHNFLVGLSLDGPADIHDAFRRTAGGEPTHDRVLRALGLLQDHGVQYNTLSCVNSLSAREPARVYGFLRDNGVRFMQFLPVVEREPDGRVTEWSVPPRDYGRFLTGVWDIWVGRDVGQVFVMNFEAALAAFSGRPGGVCHHQATCGRSVVVEHNGDVYACDHYVYPEYRLGNIHRQSFAAMLDAAGQERFGRDKHDLLHEECRRCRVLKGCRGGCPRHRFVTDGPGQPGRNYLCNGLRRYFEHIAPQLRVMAMLIDSGRPAADVMTARIVLKPRTPGTP